MDPLFLLPKQPAPIFGRTTNFEYKKTLPDTVFQSFAPAGRHTFRWQNQAGEWWVPSQSYLRLRFAFMTVNKDGRGFRAVTPDDGIAPVMNLPPHFFSRMEYYMDGNKLSELQDHVPQIDTMKHRMMKSRAYMSAVGNRACFWDPDFGARQKLICPPLGNSVNGDVGRSGDIIGQKIVMLEGAVYLSDGKSYTQTQFAARNGGDFYFGKYVDSTAVAGGPNENEVEFYGLVTTTLTADGKGAVVSTVDSFAERNEKLGYRPVLGATAAPVTVTLNLTFTGGQTKTINAVYYSALGLYGVFRSNYQNNADAKHLTGNMGQMAEAIETYWATDVDVFSFDTKSNRVKSVIVTPLEPSKQILPSTRHEICWKPTLGIFDVAHALPTSRHELHLQIPNDYQVRCLDFGKTNPTPSWITNKILDARLSLTQSGFPDSEFNKVFLRIESIEFFAAMASGPRADDAKFVLDLREFRMIPQAIPLSQTNASTTYAFNLAPNTSSVSVAFQSLKAGNGSCSLSKFIVPTQFHIRGAETSLSRFYVNFANQNRPREENESFITYVGPGNTQIEAGGKGLNSAQFFTQRYLETMTNTGQLFKPGGCETLEEWLERGAYYNWMWPRDGNDLSTRFHVFCAFEPALKDDTVEGVGQQLLLRRWPFQVNEQNNDIQILVFDMIPRAFALTLRNGAVISAETTSAMVGDGVRRLRQE